MMNFKTLFLIGAMLVSTTGVGVAQVSLTICCPKNVNKVLINQCGSNGNCSGTFTDSEGYTWNVIPQQKVAKGENVNVKSPPTSLTLNTQFTQCNNYTGSTSTVSSLKVNLVNFSLQNCTPQGQTCFSCPVTEK